MPHATNATCNNLGQGAGNFLAPSCLLIGIKCIFVAIICLLVYAAGKEARLEMKKMAFDVGIQNIIPIFAAVMKNKDYGNIYPSNPYTLRRNG